MSTPPVKERNDLQVIKSLLPYIWQFKTRVILAMLCLIAAKVASVMLPMYLKNIVDSLSIPATLLAIPVMALLGYGFARLASNLFGELRDALFARVTQGAIKKVATEILSKSSCVSSN